MLTFNSIKAQKILEQVQNSTEISLRVFLEENYTTLQESLRRTSRRGVYDMLKANGIEVGSLSNFYNVWRKVERNHTNDAQKVTDTAASPRESTSETQKTSVAAGEQTQKQTRVRSAGLPREKFPDGREIIIENGYRTFEI